jgi:ubiquinone/menaquinone biosynthesis C-methylase UbiE
MKRRRGAGPVPGPDLAALAAAAANAARYDAPGHEPLPASLERLIEFARPQGDWFALDVATGHGDTLFAIAPHVAHVCATDRSPQRLAVAARLAGGRSITNAEFREADACALPFEAEAFDLVTCRHAPHRFDRIATFLAEVHRVLKPHGVFGLIDPVAPDRELVEGSEAEIGDAAVRMNAMELLCEPEHQRFLGVAEWRSMVRRAGFAITHEELCARPVGLHAWVAHSAKGRDYEPTLAQMLDDAPPLLREFLRPEERTDGWWFTLTDALFIGRRV